MYDEKFKMQAARFYETHPELSPEECAAYFGVSKTTLDEWYGDYLLRQLDEPSTLDFQGLSEEEKAIVCLEKQLRDSEEALALLKEQRDYRG